MSIYEWPLPSVVNVETITRSGDGTGTWAESWASGTDYQCKVDLVQGSDVPDYIKENFYSTHIIFTEPISGLSEKNNRLSIDGNKYQLKFIEKVYDEFGVHHYENYCEIKNQ